MDFLNLSATKNFPIGRNEPVYIVYRNLDYLSLKLCLFQCPNGFFFSEEIRKRMYLGYNPRVSSLYLFSESAMFHHKWQGQFRMRGGKRGDSVNSGISIVRVLIAFISCD